MANLWDELDESEQNELVQAHLSGSKKDNANLSRARDQLANNPNLVARLAEETGIADGKEIDPELDDADPDGEDESMDGQTDIDRAVSASLDSENMQETGSVTRQTDIPPPQEGEDLDTYMQRLMQQKKKAPQMPGRRAVPVDQGDDDLME